MSLCRKVTECMSNGVVMNHLIPGTVRNMPIVYTFPIHVSYLEIRENYKCTICVADICVICFTYVI